MESDCSVLKMALPSYSYDAAAGGGSVQRRKIPTSKVAIIFLDVKVM